MATDPQTLGLAGAAQVLRLEREVELIRRGQVVGRRSDTAYAVTSWWPEEAGPQRLLESVRSHWTIENGQHHRRDRTQDEDRCMVGQTNSAQVLSLFRSLAIFLHEDQRERRGGEKSLPDYQRKVCQKPWALIRKFISDA